MGRDGAGLCLYGGCALRGRTREAQELHHYAYTAGAHSWDGGSVRGWDPPRNEAAVALSLTATATVTVRSSRGLVQPRRRPSDRVVLAGTDAAAVVEAVVGEGQWLLCAREGAVDAGGSRGRGEWRRQPAPDRGRPRGRGGLGDYSRSASACQPQRLNRGCLLYKGAASGRPGRGRPGHSGLALVAAVGLATAASRQ